MHNVIKSSNIILSFKNDFDVDKYFENLESKNLVANKKDSLESNINK